VFGTAGCFYANALSFIAVIVAVSQVEIPPPSTLAPIPKSMLHSLKEGLDYVVESGVIWFLILLAATSILGVPLVTMLPVFARNILSVGSSGYGILMAALGAGAVLGAVTVAYLGDFPKKGRFVGWMILLFALGEIVFTRSHVMALSMACIFVFGFSMVGFSSVINTLVQKKVPDHLRGRAISIFVFSFGGCMPIGNLLAGWLAKHYKAPTALLSQGLVLVGVTLFIYFARPEISLVE
jgi:predicted MFS family arabinose efflux permease